MSTAKYRIYTDESGWHTGNKKDTFASIAAITVDKEKIKINEAEKRWQEWIVETKSKTWEMKFQQVKSWDAISAVMKILNDIDRKVVVCV